MLNSNPLKSEYLHNSYHFQLQGHGNLCSLLLPAPQHQNEQLPSTLSQCRSSSKNYGGTGGLLPQRESQSPRSLVICSVIVIWTQNPHPEHPPPLQLPPHDCKLVTGCGQHYFIVPEEMHMGEKAKWKKMSKSREIWGWFCLWVRAGSFSQV